MKHVKDLLETLTGRLEGLARSNAVVAQPVVVGDRHMIPLCELSMGMGAGGGIGEGEPDDSTGYSGGKGMGGGAGGGAKVSPVAVIVVDGADVRLEILGS